MTVISQNEKAPLLLKWSSKWLGWEYTEQYQYIYKQKLIQIKKTILIHWWSSMAGVEVL